MGNKLDRQLKIPKEDFQKIENKEEIEVLYEPITLEEVDSYDETRRELTNDSWKNVEYTVRIFLANGSVYYRSQGILKEHFTTISEMPMEYLYLTQVVKKEKNAYVLIGGTKYVPSIEDLADLMREHTVINREVVGSALGQIREEIVVDISGKLYLAEVELNKAGEIVDMNFNLQRAAEDGIATSYHLAPYHDSYESGEGSSEEEWEILIQTSPLDNMEKKSIDVFLKGSFTPPQLEHIADISGTKVTTNSVHLLYKKPLQHHLSYLDHPDIEEHPNIPISRKEERELYEMLLKGGSDYIIVQPN